MTYVPDPHMVTFSVYGLPIPSGSKVAGVSKTSGKTFVRDANSKAAPWKRQVAQVAGVAMAGQVRLHGPVALALTFVLPRPKGHYGTRGLLPSAPSHPVVKPDLTKLTRAVEDACTGLVWVDDSQVCAQRTVKVYGEPARCEVRVAAIAAAAAVDAGLTEQLALAEAS